jgi:hypothetical protein
MPPKSTPKRVKAAPSSSSTPSKKAKTKKVHTLPSDGGYVRLDSPGCGARADEVLGCFGDIKNTYLIHEDQYEALRYAYSHAKSTNKLKHLKGDLLPPTIGSTEQPLFSTWWPTDNIILPTEEHFPSCAGVGNGGGAAGVGLIRPVNTVQAEALLKSFNENGGKYNPAHPVRV